MNEEQKLNTENTQEENFNFYEFFFKYLAYWPWFLAGVIVTVAAAFVYLRYQAPVYNVSASVLVQEKDQRSSNAAAGPLASIQDLGMFSMTNNFDNEVEILRSRTLIQKVVTTLNLYISCLLYTSDAADD